MGLTGQSTGKKAFDGDLHMEKLTTNDKVVALAGNPNVGKSTVFNSLTGLKQHTGNWPGKTVKTACGNTLRKNRNFVMVDLPGTYSLMANSAEEEVARDYLCFGNPDATVVVTDATCLTRNLNLVLQTLEITHSVVVCVNLIDEAAKKKIHIDLAQLSAQLGVPVVGTDARSGEGLGELMDAVNDVSCADVTNATLAVKYCQEIEEAISMLLPVLEDKQMGKLNRRWVALRLLDKDESLLQPMQAYLGYDLYEDELLKTQIEQAWTFLYGAGMDSSRFRDLIVSGIFKAAESIGRNAIRFDNEKHDRADRRIDRVLTSKTFGIPVMLALLGLILWLTIVGANVPSKWIAGFLFGIEAKLTAFFAWLGTPAWVHGALVLGLYRTLAWVVSVMLPPMAIFFPLFTLLEDLGYLPRVAFNLDKLFKKACAHGKQALTMCMGFGCNAAGIIGCRIIDSPRERLIAMITNSFVPCNGRFPTLIAIITMFFASYASGIAQTLLSALLLTVVVVFGIFMTLCISKLLSKTILKGLPSSFSLELPPYRKPQIGKVIVRSIFDRTLFVLGRAVTVAAPAGLLIWGMANIHIGSASVLAHCAHFFDPFARLIGLDGFILMAFILGFPANEIVVPIIIMSYMAAGSMLELDSLCKLHVLLIAHGWTWLTAVCTMLFSLMHWPCGTTILTVRKETQSAKWAGISFLVPTITGIAVCFVIANAARILGLV
jgi:ferrous iron transport protein B